MLGLMALCWSWVFALLCFQYACRRAARIEMRGSMNEDDNGSLSGQGLESELEKSCLAGRG